MDQTIFEEIN